MSRRRSIGNDPGIGFVVWLILIVFLMPIAGIYLLVQRDSGMKALGAVLTILGIVVWIILGVYSNI